MELCFYLTGNLNQIAKKPTFGRQKIAFFLKSSTFIIITCYLYGDFGQAVNSKNEHK